MKVVSLVETKDVTESGKSYRVILSTHNSNAVLWRPDPLVCSSLVTKRVYGCYSFHPCDIKIRIKLEINEFEEYRIKKANATYENVRSLSKTLKHDDSAEIILAFTIKRE